MLNNINKTFAGLIFTFLSFNSFSQTQRSYLIYDGQSYTSERIESAVGSPIISPTPRSLPDGAYVIPRAVDGHYYLHGFVNGYAMVFLVDTGASISVIPAKLSRNAGIRAGLVQKIETANGVSQVGVSKGNQVLVGPYKINNVKIGIQENLSIPLLGMDILNQFQLTYANGSLTLRPARQSE
jgi:aspartyl protease family protein